MLADPSIHATDVYAPPGHGGEGLLLLDDLVGFTGSGLSRTHRMRDAGIKAAPEVPCGPRQSLEPRRKKREILMNDFMLIPSADATAEEHARHAINIATAMASEEPRRTLIGSGQE